MIPKNWWSSIHLPDATGNLPVLFALFVHAGDFVQQINGNVRRLPMLHVNVTTDEEPRRTKFCIESKAEGLKMAKNTVDGTSKGWTKNQKKQMERRKPKFDMVRQKTHEMELKTPNFWQMTVFFLLEMKLWFFPCILLVQFSKTPRLVPRMFCSSWASACCWRHGAWSTSFPRSEVRKRSEVKEFQQRTNYKKIW